MRPDTSRPASTLAAGVAVVAVLLALALSAHAGLPAIPARTPPPLAGPGLVALVPLVWGAAGLVCVWLLERARTPRPDGASARETGTEARRPLLAPEA